MHAIGGVLVALDVDRTLRSGTNRNQLPRQARQDAPPLPEPEQLPEHTGRPFRLIVAIRRSLSGA